MVPVPNWVRTEMVSSVLHAWVCVTAQRKVARLRGALLVRDVAAICFADKEFYDSRWVQKREKIVLRPANNRAFQAGLAGAQKGSAGKCGRQRQSQPAEANPRTALPHLA